MDDILLEARGWRPEAGSGGGMDGWMDGWMDGRMDGWTETASYRDARMHLIMMFAIFVDLSKLRTDGRGWERGGH